MKLLCRIFGHKMSVVGGNLKCERCDEDFKHVRYVTEYKKKRSEIENIYHEINKQKYKENHQIYQLGVASYANNLANCFRDSLMRDVKYTGKEIAEIISLAILSEDDRVKEYYTRLQNESNKDKFNLE